MSSDDKIYQLVFLVDVNNLRTDRLYKKYAIISALKILTFYARKARSESKQLQWGFTFYKESSYLPKSLLPVCKFRDFDLKNLDEFEDVLDKIANAPLPKDGGETNKCCGSECVDQFCDCRRNKPGAVLTRAFTEVLSSFPWDNPDISSPVKIIPKRTKGRYCETLNGHSRRSTRNASLVVERQPKSNILFLFSKCPLSRAELAAYTNKKGVDTDSDLLLEELMPTGIRKDFNQSKRIALFWIDTHSKIANDDLSGLCILAQALDELGKLITLPALLSAKDLQFIADATINREDYCDANPDTILPDSAILSHYLVNPSIPCPYENGISGNSVSLKDQSGSRVADLHFSIVVPSPTGDNRLGLRSSTLTLLGTLSMCQVPLCHIVSHPVYCLREMATQGSSLWVQMLAALVKKNMILVVESEAVGGCLPAVCFIQALTEISASLTFLRVEGMISIYKKVAFQNNAPKVDSSEVTSVVQQLQHASFENDDLSEQFVGRTPADRDTFQPALLESWLLPSAVPSSLSVLSGIFSNCEWDNEDIRLLERLQKAYVERKAKRLTSRDSTASTQSSPTKRQRSPRKSVGSPTRRSPRKKVEAQACRRSPRKAVRKSGKGSLLVKSLSDMDRHGRSNTAPTRVDLIIQNSKQTRSHSTDEGEKKPGRRSTETASQVKKEEQVEVCATEEELFTRIKDIHQGALIGSHQIETSMIKVAMLISAFVSKNQESKELDILKRSIWLNTADVAKKHAQNLQDEKVREFECQLLLWMEAINRGWMEESDRENATEQVVMMLRRLSFLLDTGALPLQLSDLLYRYGDSQPAVLYEVYTELGQPVPAHLECMFSPDEQDTTLDSQPPDSALSYVDSVNSHLPGILSNKQKTRKMMRHTSFHVIPQRQIKVNVGNKKPGTRGTKRRSARIASTTKVKPKAKDVEMEDTKQVRRNLFSGAGGLCGSGAGAGGVKLERRQSVAVMETYKSGKSAKSRVKQSHNQKGHQRRGSLVTETPAHKQLPNQLWQRQERLRQRSSTVTTDVTVIQESPDKKLKQEVKGVGGPKVTNFVKRASFYSEAPDKISRNVLKCEKLEARMTKRLLSPRHAPSSAPGALASMFSRRRIQPTTLFSKLFDPSPRKPVRNGSMDMLSPIRAVSTFGQQPQPETVTTRQMMTGSQTVQGVNTEFSSPSKNTRGRMRLFQSPSPKNEVSIKDAVVPLGTPKKSQYDSPLKKTFGADLFDSPSKNTRLQTNIAQSPLAGHVRLHSSHSNRPSPSSVQRLVFQSPPPGESSTQNKVLSIRQSSGKAMPTKIKRLFQSPPPAEQKTPTKSMPVHQSLGTPTKMSIPMPDFSSPSNNTRSHSRIFQPPYEEGAAPRVGQSGGPVRRLPTTLMSSSEIMSEFSSMMNSANNSTVQIFAQAQMSSPVSKKKAVVDLGVRIQSPIHGTMGVRQNISHTPSKNLRSHTLEKTSPNNVPKIAETSIQSTPVKSVAVPCQLATPTKISTPFPDFGSPSSNTRSQSRIFPPSDRPVASDRPIASSALFQSPSKSSLDGVDNVLLGRISPEVASPLIRRVKSARASIRGSQDSISSFSQEHCKSPSTPRGKRKLMLMASPDKQEGTPTKRHRSSLCSQSSEMVSQVPMDYIDNEEVFIESSHPTKHPDVLTASSLLNNRLFCTGSFSDFQPLRNPSVEFLKHQSTGSSVPSPIFPGMERLLSEEVASSPASPVFETVTPSRPNKENKTVVSPTNTKSALSHFSPQLSRKSISHLVTSPLLDIEDQKARQNAARFSSPDKFSSVHSPIKSDASGNISDELQTDGRSGSTPRAGKKTFSRNPTKLAL